MEKDWQLIYSTGVQYKAEMVKDILNDNDIEAILLNRQDSLYLFGDIEVFAKTDNIIRAKFLIKDL